MPIGKQLRPVILRISERFIKLSAPGFALNYEKHIALGIGHANIGATAFCVVPEMPLFFKLNMLWTVPFCQQTTYALEYNKVFFLIKAIVALPALDSDRIYQLFLLGSLL